jgi:hypothetical protein
MENFKIEDHSKIETGFSTPENYFENLESTILQKIENKQVKVVSIFLKPKYWIAAAAAIFVFGLFLNIFNYKSQEENFADEEFLTSQTDFSTEDLAEYLTENELKKLEENYNVSGPETTEVSTKNQ